MPAWNLSVSGPALRGLESLPEKYAHAVVHLFGALAENPRRVGKQLRNELRDEWVARRGPYRVIYEIDDERSTVTILRVAHRAHIYRRM